MSTRRLNVFLSSTGKDLDLHREAIAAHLRAADAFHLVHSETFGARPRGAVDVCRERVRECDVLVGLIGHYRGWEPDGDNTQRSITEMEYDWAAEHGLERLMYVLPGGAADPAALGLAMTPEAICRQGAFRARVLASDLHNIRVHDGQFVDPGHLTAAIAIDLNNLLYGRMLAAIRAAEGTPRAAAPPADAGPAAPSPEAALASLANDPELDRLLADPGQLDMRAVEAAVAHRAANRVAHAREARAQADADLAAAAADYARLGALSFGIDAAKAYRYFALAAGTGAADGATLYWLARTARDAGKVGAAVPVLEAAVARLDDSEDAPGAFWAFIGLGDLRRATGDLASAREAYETARDIAVRAERLHPDDAEWQRNTSAALNRVGDVLVVQGRLAEALASFRDSLAIFDGLAQSDPNNAGWQLDLSVSLNKVGDVLMEQGKLSEALANYQGSLAIMERLAKSDPNNAGWQRDLAVGHGKVGNALAAAGKLAKALPSYRYCVRIFEDLANSDPNNAGWQRDLSVAYEKVGDVLRAQGELSEALESYRDSLAISDRLAKSDPNNAGWQRDLSVTHDKIGRVLERQGKVEEAMIHYRADLEIAERLADIDPSNVTWREDVEISRRRMRRLGAT